VEKRLPHYETLKIAPASPSTTGLQYPAKGQICWLQGQFLSKEVFSSQNRHKKIPACLSKRGLY
jgi:hypothetical protein